MRTIIAAAAVAALLILGVTYAAKAETEPKDVHELRAERLAVKYPKARGRVEKALAGDPKATKTLGILFEVLERDYAEYRPLEIAGSARTGFRRPWRPG